MPSLIRVWPRDHAAAPHTVGAVLALWAVVEFLRIGDGSVAVAAALALAVVPLFLRRRYPWAAFATVAGALLNYLVLPQMTLSASVAGLLALFALTRRRLVHPALLVVGTIVAAALVNFAHVAMGLYDMPGAEAAIGLRATPSYYAESSFVIGVTVAATVTAADAARAREDSRIARRAAQRRLIEMERRQAAQAERMVIARELHDIVAHSVSVIVVRAESATYTTKDLSPQAHDGFQDIAGDARSALTELRGLLNVLRKDAHEEAPIAPQPTLDSLDLLMSTHRSAGGAVDLRLRGDRPALSSAVELSVYRIVQEALTNVRRHAPGAHAVVDIDYRPDGLSLRVLDGGPGPSAALDDRAGHGLSGMRERAALLGGSLSFGPAPNGGFLVTADIPAHNGPAGGAAGEDGPSTPNREVAR